ncbi:MAG: hypothetical protein JNK73_06165 [Bacteroidia bacterium]|nr:hypothetical protein [Bacteroidia bacterium]
MVKQISSPDQDRDRVYKAISLAEKPYNIDLLNKMIDWVTHENNFDNSKFINRLVTYSQSACINEIVRLMADAQHWQIAGVVLGERFRDEEFPDEAYVLEKETPSKAIQEPRYDEQGSESELFKFEYVSDKFETPIDGFNGAVLYPLGANQYVKVLYRFE